MIGFCGKTVLRLSDESMMDQCLLTIALALINQFDGIFQTFFISKVLRLSLKISMCQSFCILYGLQSSAKFVPELHALNCS